MYYEVCVQTLSLLGIEFSNNIGNKKFLFSAKLHTTHFESHQMISYGYNVEKISIS